MENEKLSERVQREFDKWKEKYEVPDNKEFQVKTLLKLQEEYDNIEPSDRNTGTRETLLHMIQQLERNLELKEKKNSVMYIDCSRDKVVMFVNNYIYNYKIDKEDLIQNNGKINTITMNTCANFISKIAKKERSVIYIDVYGNGMYLYDLLLAYGDLEVRRLQSNTSCCI